MRDVDLTKIHYLTGPFDIETAEPGDVLVVEIQDVQPFQHQPWGFTGVFDKKNGGGFLDELYPNAFASLPLFNNSDTNDAPTELKPSGTSRASTAPADTSQACASRA